MLPLNISNGDRPSPGTGAGQPKLITIQYLRGLAALAVVVFHLGEMHGFDFPVGSAGVDVFFVISGVIMWVTTAERPIKPADFMGRRLIRVAPIYWIVTLTLCLAMALKPQFFGGKEVPVDLAVKSLLFIPVYQNGLLEPLLTQGWTLYYELFFYGVFALALKLPVRWRAPGVVGALTALVLGGALVDPSHRVLQTFTDPLLLEFVGGVSLGWLVTSERLPGARVGLLALLSGLAGFAVFDPAAIMAYRALFWGVPAILIVAGALCIDNARPQRPIKALTLLGDASYSVYLWHTLAITTAYAALIRLDLARPVTLTLTFVAAMALPIVLYLLIEKPIIGRLSRLVRRPPAPSPGTPLGSQAAD